jgi:hypothetical protein
MIYSFLGTCKINNVEPYSWLKKTLSRIPDQSIQKLDELLPCWQALLKSSQEKQEALPRRLTFITVSAVGIVRRLDT